MTLDDPGRKSENQKFSRGSTSKTTDERYSPDRRAHAVVKFLASCAVRAVTDSPRFADRADRSRDRNFDGSFDGEKNREGEINDMPQRAQLRYAYFIGTFHRIRSIFYTMKSSINRKN